MSLTIGSNIASNPYVLMSWAWKSAHKCMFVRDELNCGGKFLKVKYTAINCEFPFLTPKDWQSRNRHKTIEFEAHFFCRKQGMTFMYSPSSISE